MGAELAVTTQVAHEIVLTVNWWLYAAVVATEWVGMVLGVAAGIGVYTWVRDRLVRRGD